MPSGFNYSKWDNIEFSSDEDEKGGHPNIDQKSLVRMKRTAREQKKNQEKAEIDAMEKANREDVQRISVLAEKLGDQSLGGDEKEKLKEELDGRSKVLEVRNKALKEIEEKNQWNWDKLCTVTDEKTVVNHIDPKEEAAKKLKFEKQEKAMKAAKIRVDAAKAEKEANGGVAPVVSGAEVPELDEIDDGGLEEYITKHTDLMKKYGKCSGDAKAQEFLEKNTILLDDHASSWLLIYCLELELEKKGSLMKRVARNQLLLQYLLNLAKSMSKDPREAIGAFFRRATMAGGADDKYVAGFETELVAFIKRVQDRAVVKIKEAEEEIAKDAAVEKAERVKISPGGLDPQEVYDTLPEVMQKAFDSQVVKNLQDAVAAMTEEDAAYHMKRCVDSGLWCP